MRRIMRELPVTTTSKPSLAPLDSRESKMQIRFGEFQNNAEYNHSTARTRCVMYLLGLMYWLRTELGEPVEAVYGFYFCGSRCEYQNNTYSVGVIKLSAPKWLGEELKAETFVVTEETNNFLPMRFLIHFLKHGKQWSISNSGRLDESRRIPSLLTFPTSL
jgi:hypothetical protein